MPAKRVFDKEQEKEVCKLYKEYKTAKEISKEFNVSEAVVFKYLKLNCIKNPRKIIEEGKKFGKWVVIKELNKIKGQRFFLCRCSCSQKTEKVVRLKSLISGKSVSCGCYREERHKDRREKVVGNKYGRLVVVKDIDHKGKVRKVLCQCSCPERNEVVVILKDLKNGTTTSCGCLQVELVKERCTYYKQDYEEKHPLFCKVEEIMDDPNDFGILVKCKNSNCNKWMKPTKCQMGQRLKAIENPLGYEECNFYCSDECKGSCILFNLRSDPYEIKDNQELPWTSYELDIFSKEVKHRQLSEFGYNFCELGDCEDDKEGTYHAHHVIPKSQEWIFGLDPDNGIVVCQKCHDKLHKGECSYNNLKNKCADELNIPEKEAKEYFKTNFALECDSIKMLE